MTFGKKIEQLKGQIYDTLSSLIDNEYVLYDLPYHNNIGDLLIWEGELNFLGSLSYQMKDACSINTHGSLRDVKIQDNTIILMHGGGNFGDIWRAMQEFRLNILKKYPNNKILIFPQTVFYKDVDLMKSDAKIMGQHKNLTICARDVVSYAILKQNFSNRILLVPDMAFCIPVEQLQQYAKPVLDKTLFLKRRDCELQKSEYRIPNQFPLEICDWPSMEHIDIVQQGMRCMILLRKLGVPYLEDWYSNKIYRSNLIKKGVEFVSQYKEIYTTRLHVAILSTLLGKPFHFLDNSYGKNKNFYDTWLTDVDGIMFEKL